MFTLKRIADELRDVVAGLDPATYDGRDAARLAQVAGDVERLGAAAKVLFAKRAVDANAWRTNSHAATPEQWLAHVSGSSEGAAREALATADRITKLPATQAKLRNGSLSLTQAALVSQGAHVDPESEAKLLRVAQRGEMRNLRAEKERVVAAATDAEAAQAQAAHKNRNLRTWTRGVETHGAFSGPTTEVDKLLQALEPLRKQAFEHGRTHGPRESQDAYRFDGLIALAGGDATERAEPTGRVRVDISPLLTGETAPGEVCEIPGVGPVPVSHAREVLSHGLLELVLHDGRDVRAIVTKTRHVPEALKIAIEERDQRCKIQGCDATEHLQRHHVEEFALHQRTAYEILGRVCPDHHDQITYDGSTIEIHDDGGWTLHPPDTGTGDQRDTNAA